jgi:hypothetical protein
VEGDHLKMEMYVVLGARNGLHMWMVEDPDYISYFDGPLDENEVEIQHLYSIVISKIWQIFCFTVHRLEALANLALKLIRSIKAEYKSRTFFDFFLF